VLPIFGWLADMIKFCRSITFTKRGWIQLVSFLMLLSQMPSINQRLRNHYRSMVGGLSTMRHIVALVLVLKLLMMNVATHVKRSGKHIVKKAGL
jgi:uncharacterized membrane protein